MKYLLSALCFVLMLFTSSCSLLPQPYLELPSNKAQLTTNSALISLDAMKPQNQFTVEVSPGPHSFQVHYLALLHTYTCSFTFTAKGGSYYEVVEHFNGQPLTLYRLSHSNWFWYQRVEPIAPKSCSKVTTK